MVIIHGNIKTMEERDYRDGFLSVVDGKIAAIGDMGECPGGLLEGDEEVIDAKGHLVMPGIIEAHCHMGITEHSTPTLRIYRN